MRPPAPLFTLAAALACSAGTSVRAHEDPAQLDPVVVQGNYDNAVGTSDAASQGSVGRQLIEARPVLRPGEILEFVPGVIVTQHSGDGKANQYFLRGFNLDHGTDFATWVAGMPVNMPTHAHGHGYTDLNWLIPELVDRLRYRKGPYYAEDGDFSSAGSARIGLVDELPRGIFSATLGGHGWRRALLADSPDVGAGHLLYALEGAQNDGPWRTPERLHRLNGLLRWSTGPAADRQSITAMGYSAGWNATDQIPRRAVEAGTLDRYGSVDPTDGGRTSRWSLSYERQRRLADGVFRLDAYAIASQLDLTSNFTYFLRDPANGDQFSQSERRRVVGLTTSRSWNTTLAGLDMVNSIGLQVRHDRLDPVGLYSNVRGVRTATVQESRVRQTSIGLWADNSTQWTSWLRSVAGLRADRFDFDVASSVAGNSGRAHAGLASPKLSLVFGPWRRTEFFVNHGWGFHSNDARGATATVAASDPGSRIRPVDALVRSKGSELGLRTELVPGLQSSLALWELRLGSELVFVGDAGDIEPNRASRRRGVEWNNHYVARPGLMFDADFAFSRARFSEDDPNDATAGRHVPGSVATVVSLGATLTELGPWSGQFQLRHFGPRPLTDDGNQRSAPTTLAYLRAGYRLTPRLRLALDVFNLFDRKASDIDYYYRSRLQNEPAAGVNDIHFHPVEPRSLRLTLVANFH